MSLLLDALKKSEVQRRRGKAPPLDLASTPAASGRRRPGLRWLIVLLLGLLLLAATPWLWSELSGLVERRQVADDNESVSGGNADTTGAGPSGRAEAASGPSIASNRAAAVETSQSRRTNEPAPVAGAANARRAPESKTAPAGESATDEDDGPMKQTVRRGPQAPGAASEAQPQALQRRQQARQEQARQEQARQAEPEPEAEPEAAPKPRENFIRPWELPQAQRADFPDLDLSVHFFAERPGDRFVLINGERYAEGQQVKPGIVLAEIRRRGAVVEFGSYRVLIE